MQNLNVAVKEERDDVVFLHKIVPGAADKSYGIYVAKLAGVPSSVVQRSQEILTEMEQDFSRRTCVAHDTEQSRRLTRGGHKFTVGTAQFSLFGAESHPVVSELQDVDVDELKPLEALQLLAKWKTLV